MNDIFQVDKPKLYMTAFLIDFLAVLSGLLLADEITAFVTNTETINHFLYNFNLITIFFGLISITIIGVLGTYALTLYKEFKPLEMSFYNQDSFTCFIINVILVSIMIIFGNLEFVLFTIIFSILSISLVSFEIMFKIKKHERMNYIP